MSQATLNGQIDNDGGATVFRVRFQYGTIPALGSVTPWQNGTFAIGDTFRQVLGGLLSGTRYYFAAEAENLAGTGLGAVLSFDTNPRAIVAALPATEITNSQAVLNGLVEDDGGAIGDVRFHWGASAVYGMTTAWQPGFTTGMSFSAPVHGLQAGCAYHCRAEFRNRNGSVFSSDRAFSTLSDVGGLALIGDEALILLGGTP